MASENDDGDEDFRRAFGEHTGIFQYVRQGVNLVKRNVPRKNFYMGSRHAAENFSRQAWELLGRYIASNDHLEVISLSDIGLTDENMPKFFEHLTGSTSLKKMNLTDNDLGVNGIQSMVPFLKNSNLIQFRIRGNADINSECFRLLINALRDQSIELLDASKCGIEDITALQGCSLPHLRELDLSQNIIKNIPSFENYTSLVELRLQQNSIGREGSRSIAKLLQNPSSKLSRLDLVSNGIGDEGAEILANALKHNAKLKYLDLSRNKIRGDGHISFLKLLNDVSSINGTYNSNHTLIELKLADYLSAEAIEPNRYIKWAIQINKGKEDEEDESDSEDEEDEADSEDEDDDHSDEGNPEWAGRKKVIAFQLDSDKRMAMCRLQRMDYCYNSFFADIDPLLLPDILSIVGREHSQNELYHMLAVVAPDLVSLIDKTSLLKDAISKKTALIAALSSEMSSLAAKVKTLVSETNDMRKRLNPNYSGGQSQSSMGVETIGCVGMSANKRRRSASF